jgi:hypothetical protein
MCTVLFLNGSISLHIVLGKLQKKWVRINGFQRLLVPFLHSIPAFAAELMTFILQIPVPNTQFQENELLII